MKAIVLAAGVGSRLRPLTDAKPKTMVCVNGKPIISYIIDSLVAAGVTKIVICTGYRSESIVDFVSKTYGGVADVTFVENARYDKTNNMYSLYLARHQMDDDILLMNADLVFDQSIMRDLTRCPGNAVAVDHGRYLEESMKIVVDGGRVTSISKAISPADAYGASIDIYKFTKATLPTLVGELVHIIENEKNLNQWTEVLLDRLFREDRIAAAPMDISKRRWVEIDNFVDLAEAEMAFNSKLEELRRIKLFIVDKDGTVAVGRTPIDGASDFVRALSGGGSSWVVASNNSSRTSQQHEATLSSLLGAPAVPVVSSLDFAIDSLLKKGVRNLFWVANEQVGEHLRRHFEYSDSEPDALLLTYDTALTYEKILKLIRFVRKGVDYYATHVDRVCPTEDGPIPDIGLMAEMVATVTGRYPKADFGKPSPAFLDFVLERFGVAPEESAVIGDRLYTDIAMGRERSVMTVLVLSGETSRAEYEASGYQADVVVPSVKDLVKYVS